MINKMIGKYALAATVVVLSACLTQADVSSDGTTALPQLSTGSVTGFGPTSCGPSGLTGASCYAGTVNCPNAASAGFVIEVSNPSGTPKGTIVTHSENSGEGFFQYPDTTNDLASGYVSAGFQVVQISWDTPLAWEGSPSGNPFNFDACRPATLFQYIYANYYSGGNTPVYSATTNSTAGFCLEGHSAGSAAVAYYLTHFNGAKYVDKALLSSGPQFADLDQGCEVPNFSPVTICPNGGFSPSNPSGWPCANGVDAGGTWTENPVYLGQQPDGWLGNYDCANSKGTQTTPIEATTWLSESINDAATPADANYYMPKTSISAYECGPDVNNMNNPSEAQGWLYFSQFTHSKVANLTVHEVRGCKNTSGPNPEYVWDAPTVDGVTGTPLASMKYYGTTAIYNDMISDCYRRH